jgi:excisionase family DNA binding protein
MEIKNDYLTTAQVTTRLGVARSTLNRWVKEGKLPRYSLGGKVLFKPSDVDSLVKLADNVEFGAAIEVEEPSSEELGDARLAFKEMADERKSRTRMSNNDDIMQIAAEILAKSRLISNTGDKV